MHHFFKQSHSTIIVTRLAEVLLLAIFVSRINLSLAVFDALESVLSIDFTML